MKKKHHGITTLVIAIVAIGAMIGYYGSGAWQLPLERSSGAIPPNTLTPIKVPSADQVRQMAHLYDRMAQLAMPGARTAAARPLSLFGDQGDAHADAGDAGGESVGLADRNMRLTLTVSAGLQRYCILDGDFLAEGAAASAGCSIIKIEAHRVLVSHGSERRWIYLNDDQARSAATHELKNATPGKGQS